MIKFALKKECFAFTLAEVLITLGVIGIIAAMTIPTLISNYQKIQTVSQLKKQYTNLAQTVRLSETDNGSNSTWDWGTVMTPRQSFDTYWAPYLKIAQYCNSYSDCGYTATRPWKWLDGTTQWTVDVVKTTTMTSVILADGTYMWVRNDKDVAIDLNGSKGPNTIGKDVFHFTVFDPQGLMPKYYYENFNDDCFANDAGDACASEIMKHGWQMPSDYPW